MTRWGACFTVHSSRLVLLHQELTGAWRELMVALVDDNKPLIAERALIYAYYWCVVCTLAVSPGLHPLRSNPMRAEAQAGRDIAHQ